MRSRILLERLMTMLLDPKQASNVKTQHVKRLRIHLIKVPEPVQKVFDMVELAAVSSRIVIAG